MDAQAGFPASKAPPPPSLSNLLVLETGSDTPFSRKSSWVSLHEAMPSGPFSASPVWDFVLLTSVRAIAAWGSLL